MNNISNADLTFITNEEGQTLKDRFEQLIKDSRYFDCLVAYFYISGFHAIYKTLEKTEKIRILIGIGTSQGTYDEIKEAGQTVPSHYETKKITPKMIEDELAESEDKPEIEEGVQKFIDWLKSGKIVIRAYPSRDIHAKLYIMTFKDGDRDVGRVITGSSNFTNAGLKDNFELNVELKNRADYEFAKQKFNELWENSVDVSEEFVQTINKKTWFNDSITPYELYLKFLYEYFKDELSRENKVSITYLPDNFKDLKYQKQAVLNAKKILEEYGGVFLSDVVGLGKTYMAAMLAGVLVGRTLVIAPPALLNKANPGSWPNVFADFHVSAEFVSIGKLDNAKREIESREYKNIIIDESHRFRNESTISYENISEICRGKKVILISATPYNNSPKDLLSQIKLFQSPKKSTIPGMPDLVNFFNQLNSKLKKIDKQKNYSDYLRITRENAKEIREKVLKHIMVRRTRSEIEKYFQYDLEKNNITFPIVNDPKPFYYQFNTKEDQIFTQTISMVTKDFKYTRYMPLLYLKDQITSLEEQSQKNMGGFMKVLLVKRLESSFYAFRKSIERFIDSYTKFIRGYEKGNVYISRDYSNKIYELSEEGDDESIQQLIEEDKVDMYKSTDFRDEFERDLRNDLKLLKKIKSMWDIINRDPKAKTLIESLKNNHYLKDKKIIIFTESKETAEYLVDTINENLGNIALLFHGQSPGYTKYQVIENFDARAKEKKNDYRILVTTDVLSEGVNLHSSNIVINYDIPWNPTKMMQRVGRVNRIDTQFEEIHTFNFFPTIQSDDEINLTKIARTKIEAFLNLLGGDASILTEGEPIGSHELFDKLLSKQTIIGDEGEEESELKYLRIIEGIRDNNSDLFERIKELPKKSRSSKEFSVTFDNLASSSFLITFFRRGKLMKFVYSAKDKEPVELDFLSAAKIFESNENEKRLKTPTKEYYELLDKNKSEFFKSTTKEEYILGKRKGGKDKVADLIKILEITKNNGKQLTEEQTNYIKNLIKRLKLGTIPKNLVQKALKKLGMLNDEIKNPLKVVAAIQKEISSAFLKSHYAEESTNKEEKREIILSLFVNKIDT